MASSYAFIRNESYKKAIIRKSPVHNQQIVTNRAISIPKIVINCHELGLQKSCSLSDNRTHWHILPQLPPYIVSQVSVINTCYSPLTSSSFNRFISVVMDTDYCILFSRPTQSCMVKWFRPLIPNIRFVVSRVFFHLKVITLIFWTSKAETLCLLKFDTKQSCV